MMECHFNIELMQTKAVKQYQDVVTLKQDYVWLVYKVFLTFINFNLAQLHNLGSGFFCGRLSAESTFLLSSFY